MALELRPRRAGSLAPERAAVCRDPGHNHAAGSGAGTSLSPEDPRRPDHENRLDAGHEVTSRAESPT